MYQLPFVRGILHSLILLTLVTTPMVHSLTQKDECHSVHNYTVSSNGHDVKDCTTCATLQYLMQENKNIHKKCVNIKIISLQIISGKLSLDSFSDLSIVGDSAEPVHLKCRNYSGIEFKKSQRIRLENLYFSHCGVDYSYPNVVYSRPITEYAAAYFYQGSDIQISGCVFSSGYGTGVILDDVMGNNSVSKTTFLNNESVPGNNFTSGGLIVKRQHLKWKEAHYAIDGCKFSGNVNFTRIEDPLSLGGGITLYFTAADCISSVLLSNTCFSGNQALVGAGIRINHSGSNHSTHVNVSGSKFESNRVTRQGGGISLRAGGGNLSSVNLHIENCTFINNTANWGGGISTYTSDNYTHVSVTAHNSSWIGNNAKTSGHAASFTSSLMIKQPSNQSAYTLVAQFTNCSFNNNTNKGYYKYINSIGSVYLKLSRADFTNCDFDSNHGSALYLGESSYATFAGETVFSNNYGTYGGAVNLYRNALIALVKDVTLSFKHNNAFIDGGAIFSSSAQDEQENDKNNCVFESLAHLLQSSDKIYYNVTFSDNLASGKAHSIFIGNPSGCINNSSEAILLDKRIFSYKPYCKSLVTAVANEVSLSGKNNSSQSIEVMLGERFYLYPTVLDIFNNSVYTSGHIMLLVSSENYLPSEDFILVGPHSIGLDEFTKNNELYIKGNEVTSDISNLVLQLVYNIQNDYHDGDTWIDIKLVKCKIGFMYNSTSQLCKCTVMDNLLCPSLSTLNSYACIRYGYWYGFRNTTKNTALPCPGGNCHYVDGKCPNSEKCEYSPHDFCRLYESDNLCSSGRTGILCSECKTNYSFTFGALRCVPSHTCDARYTVLILSGIIIYWIVFIILTLIILTLKLSMGSGFIYGIVYYFSSVTLFTGNTITDQFLQTVINTCVALTQLCPRGFGDIEKCFAESMNLNLHHQLFRFVTPIFVISIILTIIWFSRYCRCPAAISLSQNSPIHAICILVIFSYTSLTYTSFQILSPLHYDGRLYVHGDPKVRYFGPEHLPYAILALFTEVFISLPICFLLLLAPCLSKRLNLVKLRLKPFLDEFQACYHPKYRWFAGFYFLARQLLYLFVLATSHAQLPQDNHLLHYLNGIIVIIHVSFQPYKLKWLNFIDTILLLDVFFLSFFEIGSVKWSQKSVAYVLILIPSIYLVGIIAVLLFKKIHQSCLRSCCTKMDKMEDSQSVIATSTSVSIVNEDDLLPKSLKNSTIEDSFFRDTGEREPLLEDKRTSYSTSRERWYSPFTTTSSLRVSRMKKFPPQNDKASTS